MYENKNKPLLSKKEFRLRMYYHLLASFSLVILTLGFGVAGHIYFDNMKLTSAVVASITLTSGLGLSILPETTSGQLFVSLYAIFSGYVYIITSSIIIAPILHRFLHKFHLDEQ
jgi:hypothetical protein